MVLLKNSFQTLQSTGINVHSPQPIFFIFSSQVWTCNRKTVACAYNVRYTLTFYDKESKQVQFYRLNPDHVFSMDTGSLLKNVFIYDIWGQVDRWGSITLKILVGKHPAVYFSTGIAEFTISFSQFNKTKIKTCIFISSERGGVGPAEDWMAVQMFNLPSMSQTEIVVRNWCNEPDDDTFQPTTEICPFKSALSPSSSPPAATHLHPSTSSSTVIWLSPSRWAEAPTSTPCFTPSPVSRSGSDGKEQPIKTGLKGMLLVFGSLLPGFCFVFRRAYLIST